MTQATLPIVERPSPNHGERRGGLGVTMLVLHYTGMPTAEGAVERLCDPASSVSAHYVVDDEGTILRLVAEDRRAWHAGVGRWRDQDDINSVSIGIEITNPGDRAFPQPQMTAVATLSHGIIKRHGIPARHVLGHSDVAPGRKQDPGPLFDWCWLAGEGVGLWPAGATMPGRDFVLGDSGEDVERFQAALATFGYGLVADGRYGPVTATAVTAFQLHFRPGRIDGHADAETRDRLAGVLAQALI
ncbi:MAG: N-acetylmuramoyl-L-alanine amidase [Alphaproteobacteria bacterium]|jgi:N-acetylmuramoyl-L-alanine amidase|nr:N-acetylmuramoyl-L-alanine amidase [Rhodospirillaceae bacterium]MDG2483293.1 N-acetylmuramoyl-L-alanine amidase [Alphaproteobacteria bacterium]MBT6203917.1 N-acetylmuramoyl-L-alanine amidase [Rhodospirillaceae bacterium]MBT6512571.1 N-acetylmuramoyl-L-alanine amidase [Rhodospirillaceae bacterium]MBT7614568.1 N-acetylmuramoyl-L-alanine amidase [Rhodospirillaceae bacterium]